MTATFTNETKHSSTMANTAKSATSSFTNQAISTAPIVDFVFLIDNTFSFLIDNTYNLLIGGSSGGGAISWSNQTKN